MLSLSVLSLDHPSPIFPIIIRIPNSNAYPNSRILRVVIIRPSLQRQTQVRGTSGTISGVIIRSIHLLRVVSIHGVISIRLLLRDGSVAVSGGRLHQRT